MLDTKSKLITEFLKDHQQFSRLLFEIEKLLGKGKVDEARVRANELDKLAGPHIAFEEAELYPRLAELGAKQVTEELLVDQHHDAIASVRLLIENEQLSESQIKKAQDAFRDGLSHAEHCGSLISLLSQLDERQQAESLTVLLKLRDEGKLWTEL